MGYLSFWSGGKDSCWAYYQAVQQGYAISGWIHYLSPRPFSHSHLLPFIEEQAKSAHKILFKIPSTEKGKVKEIFKAEIEKIKKANSLKGIIFGDIYLEAHRRWLETLCWELQIEPVFPLWHQNTTKLTQSFLQAGFKAIIVSVKNELIDRKWLGKFISEEFIEKLEESALDVGGEEGEYHTLVVDGPIFKFPIDFSIKGVKEEGKMSLLELAEEK